MDSKQRIAVVTGGNRGIGLAICRQLAQLGYQIVLTSRDEVQGLGAQQRLVAEGAEVGYHPLDVTDAESVHRLAEVLQQAYGRVDVLVNNAGMSPLYASLSDVTESLWDKVIGVNLKGPFRLSALVGERMARGAGGSIINVSSVASIRPTPIETPYAAAKAGLNAITVACAHAFGPTVRVNCIMAGPFLTDISKAWPPEGLAHFERVAALGRAGHPDEIVGAALYFASDASSFTTGAILRVDGGQP